MLKKKRRCVGESIKEPTLLRIPDAVACSSFLVALFPENYQTRIPKRHPIHKMKRPLPLGPKNRHNTGAKGYAGC